MQVDEQILSALEDGGVDFACSVPCSMLAGLLELIEESKITHVQATREEEGVGICAGAFLAGKKPALIMQNSGLGNSVNAILSLTRVYGMSLFLLVAYRGVDDEQIEAQIPMGKATQKLLSLLGIAHTNIIRAAQVRTITKMAKRAFEGRIATAVLLRKTVWN